MVGDGAVGLLAVLASKQLRAEQIIIMSRHESRQRLALEYGATDIVTERGDEGVAKIKELTDGLGAHSTIEAVGTQESMMQPSARLVLAGMSALLACSTVCKFRVMSCFLRKSI